MKRILALVPLFFFAVLLPVQAEYVPAYTGFRVGGYGYRQFPTGEYRRLVFMEDGFGLTGEYMIPYKFLNQSVGLTANMQGAKIVPKKEGDFDFSWLLSFYGGAWMRFPLKYDLYFQPEIDWGLSFRKVKSSRSKSLYVDQLFQFDFSVRWNPPGIFNGNLEFVGTPYIECVPFKENFTTFFGVKLGAVYKLGRKIYAMQKQKEAQALAQREQDLQNSLVSSQINGITVRRNTNGLTLSMEDIQFLPNSAELAESETVKMEKLSRILRQFPNKLLVAGHCADDGSEADNMRISAERAGAVADYLIRNGTRGAADVLVTGRGSLEPIDDNSTDEGRARNRRVEITLLEDE